MQGHLARVLFPDGQVRELQLGEEPKAGELLESDELPGQWLVATARAIDGTEKAEVAYDVEVESAEGVSA